MTWSFALFIIGAVAVMFIFFYITDVMTIRMLKENLDDIDEAIRIQEERITNNNIFDEFEWDYLEYLQYLKRRIEKQ